MHWSTSGSNTSKYVPINPSFHALVGFSPLKIGFVWVFHASVAKAELQKWGQRRSRRTGSCRDLELYLFIYHSIFPLLALTSSPPLQGSHGSVWQWMKRAHTLWHKHTHQQAHTCINMPACSQKSWIKWKMKIPGSILAEPLHWRQFQFAFRALK